MATQETRSMISETSICNQALSWLGAKRIASINEQSRYAELCNENYPFLRDAVLEARMWSFALDRDASTVSNKDAWGVAFAHPVPQEWLAVWRVYKRVDREPFEVSKNWRKEGRFVLAEDDTVYMWGTKRVTDTGFFTNMFVQCLAARLACDLAIPVTENRLLQADMWGLYEKKLSEAGSRDGQQGVNESIGPSKLKPGRLVSRREQGNIE